MTEQTDAAPELPITFRDREIYVRLPSPEQLLVWRRTIRHLQGTGADGMNGEQAMAALERAVKIINSMMVNRIDIDWLDDEMLDGSVKLPDAQQILVSAIDAFADAAGAEGNRETRRAAKKAPAKKATRKKAARP
jgi:hypothetical protein